MYIKNSVAKKYMHIYIHIHWCILESCNVTFQIFLRNVLEFKEK